VSEPISELVDQLLRGDLGRDDFLQQVAQQNVRQFGEVTLDTDRERRCGYPEVIYAEGKATNTLIEICATLCERKQAVLATRVSADQATALLNRFPRANHNPVARTFRIDLTPAADRRGSVVVATAGSSDLPVAEEAQETLEWMGVATTMIHDVGVAGPHRLPMHLDTLRAADAVVVVAGMEGALPSVVGGYVACPVIAAPTSVGYGANLGGMAALLGMLNSCAANVAVVNIDAGFKAGYLAGMIAQRAHANNASR